tara:strand:- start:7375 stop:7563 length:189 start_codon:yes stop_codon:yes gene_type:complete
MTKEQKYEKIHGICDHLLEEAKKDDELQKKAALAMGKAGSAVGESQYIWYLKSIKEIIDLPE